MTSSLVGSEMCIRDRVPTGIGARSGGKGWRKGGAGDHPLRSGGKSWSRTVSYTHLTLPTICSV
eukprot:1003783-Prorocentrum_lima.AAC.1